MGSDDDERVVRELDRAWNDVYVQNDRARFADILADDFVGHAWDGRTMTRAQLMAASDAAGMVYIFNESAIYLFGPTAIARAVGSEPTGPAVLSSSSSSGSIRSAKGAGGPWPCKYSRWPEVGPSWRCGQGNA
jgi:hypothetical protein